MDWTKVQLDASVRRMLGLIFALGENAQERSMADGTTNTWYVTFEVPRTGKPLAWKRPRATVAFQNEFEAKELARTKLAEGLIVSAGTINPHTPKRTIAPTGIHQWLEET